MAAELVAPVAFDDYRRLAGTHPDAVLVEVPHAVQDSVVEWALAENLQVLIGGPLASSAAAGERIAAKADAEGRVVEAGFEARYKPVWEAAREEVLAGTIGRVVAVRAIALWDGDPSTWYYDEAASGGMPLTHLTYCFVNPLRWIFGEPTHVSAFANRVRQTDPATVREETCIVNLRFDGDVLASVVGGYVRPADGPYWNVSIVGTEATLELNPSEMGPGELRRLKGSAETRIDTEPSEDAFVRQANVFLDALHGSNRCRNTPAHALGDLLVAEAIVTSVRTLSTIATRPNPAFHTDSKTSGTLASTD